jgi:hypothetical protein
MGVNRIIFFKLHKFNSKNVDMYLYISVDLYVLKDVSGNINLEILKSKNYN